MSDIHDIADKIINLQRDLTKMWHATEPAITREDFFGLVEGNHYKNFSLWHEEDKARRDDMGHQYVYNAKRAIDYYNQLRNNYMEKIDQFVCEVLKPEFQGVPMHTETPGMIIDRLSILSLKEFHMAEEIQRTDVSMEHHKKCEQRLLVIRQQLQDLGNGLQCFLDQVKAGERGFRVYYQFKMYNDPTLNPELYKKNLESKT